MLVLITLELFSFKISVKKKFNQSILNCLFKICYVREANMLRYIHSSYESKGFSVSISRFIDEPTGAGPINSGMFLLYSKVCDLPKFALRGIVMAA